MQSVSSRLDESSLPVRRIRSIDLHISQNALAEVLDRLASSPSSHISEVMRAKRLSLREALALFPKKYEALQKQWGSAFLEEILDISQEPDRRTFEASLLLLQSRLQDEGKAPLARALLEVVLNSESAREFSPEFISGARQKLDILSGKGPVGAQIGHYGKVIFESVTDEAGLATFAVGAGFFQAARLAALSRFMRSSSPVLRGVTGEALAGLAGVTSEATGMTLSMQGFSYLSGGPVVSDPEMLFNQTLGMGATMLLLRGSAVASRQAFHRFHGIENGAFQAARLPALTSVSRHLFPQVSMFGAVALGHRVEMQLGVRDFEGNGSWLVASVASLAQFHVGNHVYARIEPRSVAQFRGAAEVYAAGLSRMGRDWFVMPGLSGSNLAWAGAQAGFAPSVSSSPATPEGVSLMASQPPWWRSGRRRRGSSPPPSVNPGRPPTPPRSFPHTRPLGTSPSPTSWEAFEQLPHPVVFTNKAGTTTYMNKAAKESFWQDGARPIDEVFELISQEHGLYKPRRADAADQIWQISTHELSNGSRMHVLTNKTEEMRAKAANANYEVANGAARNILHDLNNAVTALGLARESAEAVILESQGPRHPAVQAVITAADIVRKLFNGAKNMMVNRKAPMKLMALDEPLRQVAELMDVHLRDRSQFKFTYIPSPMPLFIKGQQEGIINSVYNLMVNAYNHGIWPMGRGEITLKAYRDGQKAVIEVSDDGAGIKPEHIPEIFKVGFTTREEYGGTGLGLGNVKSIVEAHGGEVKLLRTELGKGSTFQITLPIYVARF